MTKEMEPTQSEDDKTEVEAPKKEEKKRNSKQPVGRKAIRAFFKYTVNREEIKQEEINGFTTFLSSIAMVFVSLIAVAVAAESWSTNNPSETEKLLAILTDSTGSTAVTYILAIIGGVLFITFVAAFLGGNLHRRSAKKGIAAAYQLALDKKEKNLAEFVRLAEETRKVQGADVLKALLRVFERTQIPRDQLKILDQQFVFDKEKELFGEETMQDKLGDLFNKSIRLISKGDYTNKQQRKIRWVDTKSEELFFNPTRAVTLFLTDTQLVICDVQIDSIDGDLVEEIQRISLSKIVNIQFLSKRTRLPLDKKQLVRMAKDLGYKPEEIKEIQKGFKSDDNRPDDAPNWVYEDMQSHLRVSRTDGGVLSIPIRSDLHFGKHVAALDQENSLTQDEITVDKMVNELNRLVEHTR